MLGVKWVLGHTGARMAVTAMSTLLDLHQSRLGICSVYPQPTLGRAEKTWPHRIGPLTSISQLPLVSICSEYAENRSCLHQCANDRQILGWVRWVCIRSVHANHMMQSAYSSCPEHLQMVLHMLSISQSVYSRPTYLGYHLLWQRAGLVQAQHMLHVRSPNS